MHLQIKEVLKRKIEASSKGSEKKRKLKICF